MSLQMSAGMLVYICRLCQSMFVYAHVHVYTCVWLHSCLCVCACVLFFAMHSSSLKLCWFTDFTPNSPFLG